MNGHTDRWVLASSNRSKLAEVEAILEADDVELVPLSSFDVRLPEETGETFVENALAKARYAARATGLPAIADDSGLCVDALTGRPGIYSARFAGPSATDAENVAKLLGELADLDDDRRIASFHCVIVAVAGPDDPAPLLAHGRWQGLIAHEPRGTAGFGYDPIFIDPEFGLTAAEMDPELKNRVSHRARALATIRRYRDEPAHGDIG